MQTNIFKHPKTRVFLVNLAIIAIVLLAFVLYKPKQMITIETLALNVRTGPGLEYDIMTQVKKGSEVEVLETKDKWYHVVMADKTKGWVASWLVADEKTSAVTNIKAIVNTDNTNLRKEANTNSDIVKKLKKNASVTITNESNGWAQVEVGGKSGWIFTDLLTTAVDDKANIEEIKEIESQTIENLYARQDGTKIRSEANISAGVLETVDASQPITYVSSEGDWFKVKTTSGQTGYVANWVVSTAQPTQGNKTSAISEATIMLDPGHGGSDSGAINSDETIYEKVVTLATARYLQKELQAMGANVILTRDDDIFVPLSEIAGKSNRAKADAFISLHYDSTEIANSASGTKAYYYKEENSELAKAISTEMANILPLPNRGYDFADYQVLRENDRPAVLLELGFMNNYNDLAEFSTKGYQKKVAQAIAQGLYNYFD